MIRKVLLLGFLVVNAVYDVRYRRILLQTVPVFLISGVLLLVSGENTLVSGLTALLPGVFLLLLGKITREAVGYGDGLIVMVTGIYLGLWETCAVVMGALFLSAIWGSVLMMGKRKGLHGEISWVPFLLISYTGGLWLHGS